MGHRWSAAAAAFLVVCGVVAAADTRLSPAGQTPVGNSTLKSNGNSYDHLWPPVEFGWPIALGSLIGFFAAAFGSIGAVGGGGIFVPMLTLIIGFDPKSSTAVSKCKHPTL
ncbi:hypothetical protein EJB05_42725, partial [Eragrostis curvula]